jgi:hypothetical protein
MGCMRPIFSIISGVPRFTSLGVTHTRLRIQGRFELKMGTYEYRWVGKVRGASRARLGDREGLYMWRSDGMGGLGPSRDRNFRAVLACSNPAALYAMWRTQQLEATRRSRREGVSRMA